MQTNKDFNKLINRIEEFKNNGIKIYGINFYNDLLIEINELKKKEEVTYAEYINVNNKWSNFVTEETKLAKLYLHSKAPL